MTGPAPTDDERLRAYATSLADGVEAALPGWVLRCVTTRWTEWAAGAPGDEVRAAAQAAGEQARSVVAPSVRALLETDVDEQWTNPLALLRRAVAYPTAVLRSAGVPVVERDEQARALFPDDDYDLTPGSFADLDPALAEAGITWGAAKAHVVLARRRAEGLR